MRGLPSRAVALLGAVAVAPRAVAEPLMPSPRALLLGDQRFRVEVRLASTSIGPRFDQSASVSAVSLDGHPFLAEAGLVDEFGLSGVGVLGFEEAQAGGSFLKIGVGELVRPDAQPYGFWKPYVPRRLATTSVKRRRDGVSVFQSASLPNGPGYELFKRYRVSARHRTLLIEYRLRNTGPRAWEFDSYNHNWFAAGEGAPSVETEFPLDLPASPLLQTSKSGRGTRLEVIVPVVRGASVGADVPVPASQNAMLVRSDGAQVEVRGDFPLARFALYVEPGAVCPEAFVRATLLPGQTRVWRRFYRFTLGAPR